MTEWIQVAGTVIVIVGGLGGFVVRWLNARIESVSKSEDETADKLAEAEKDIVRLEERQNSDREKTDREIEAFTNSINRLKEFLYDRFEKIDERDKKTSELLAVIGERLKGDD